VRKEQRLTSTDSAQPLICFEGSSLEPLVLAHAINMKRIVRKWLRPGGKRRRLIGKIMEIWDNRFWGGR